MVPPVLLPLPFLRLPPLPLRRLRPILAASSSLSSHDDDASRLFPRARDKKIEMGRYKGRMLGTLPSSYLKWLADQEDNPAYDLYIWPALAKAVLEDPVYQDRIEYEPVLRMFEGGAKGNFIFSGDFNMIQAYRDIGDRYGWDWDNKDGWAKVKRDFIGTSYSGRIPRKKDDGAQLAASDDGVDKKTTGNLDDRNGARKPGFFVGKKRVERIERMRLKREERMQMVKSDRVVEEEVSEEKEEEVPRTRIKKERVRKAKGDLGRKRRELGLGRNDEMISSFAKIEPSLENGEVSNPFPGRDALFQKLKREGKIR